MPPKVVLVTDVLYNWISQFKIIGNSFWIFDPSDLDLWPSDPKIDRVHLLTRMEWMCGQSLRKVGRQGVLELLIWNGFGTFDSGDLDPKINRVHLLPRIDVWIEFEEGRSRCSWVIDRKWFGHIWPQWPLTTWPQSQ